MLKSELDSVTNLFLMFNISSVKFDVSCSITSWPCIYKATTIVITINMVSNPWKALVVDFNQIR